MPGHSEDGDVPGGPSEDILTLAESVPSASMDAEEKAPQGPSHAYPMRFAAFAAAWLFPGAGHFLLRRPGRGLAFFLLAAAALATGLALDGHLYERISGDVFATLGWVACMGLGPSYFLMRGHAFALGNPLSPWAEYGNRFVLLAGTMNLLVMLDAFDVAVGRKEKGL